MTTDEFEVLDELAEATFEAADKWLDTPELHALKAAIQQASAKLPQGHSLEFSIVLRVFDEEREKSVTMLTTGLAPAVGREPYRTSGDSTPHRYIVDGQMCQIPHDYCPHCWDIWDFKLLHPQCRHCGYSLGKEVRLLLDSDVCPHCEQGKVSARKTTCDRCGERVDPNFVSWG